MNQLRNCYNSGDQSKEKCANRLKQIGTPPEDLNQNYKHKYTLKSLFLAETQNSMAEIEELEVSVDVSNIHEDTEFEIPHNISERVSIKLRQIKLK